MQAFHAICGAEPTPVSGQSNRIPTEMYSPQGMLNDVFWGAIGGGAGYGIQSMLGRVLGNLGEIGAPDEFMPPSATGQWMKWSQAEQLWFNQSQALSEQQLLQLSRIALENNCVFGICGGYAESPNGFRNRYYGVQFGENVGPFQGKFIFRNTGLSTFQSDLDYWTPPGTDLSESVKRQIIKTIFGPEVEPSSVRWDNYNTHPYPIDGPEGSIIFKDGTIFQKLGPWQLPFDWNILGQ